MVWETHLHGAPLVAVSRILPIVIAMALAWWAVRRLGSAVLDTVPLLSLVATSLSLRLVFEQNLFGYYFMAIAVLVVLLDVVQGRIRWQVVAWLTLVTLAFNPAPTHLRFREYLPIFVMLVALVLILFDAARRGRVRWYAVAWLALVTLAFANMPPWSAGPIRHPLPIWLWQVVLVGIGVGMSAAPLFASVRHQPGSPPRLSEEPVLVM